jgi:type IV fimbrial biogenesis protein FimT
MCATSPRQHGFTLTELLLCIGLIATATTFAIPDLSLMMTRNRVDAISNQLLTLINLTRSEAIKRGQTVTLCPISDSPPARPLCADSTNWQQGWLIFADTNGNGSADAAETVIKTVSISGKGIAITSTINANKQYLSFLPTGISQWPNRLATGSLTVCAAPIARKLIINSGGRVRISKEDCV